MHHPALIIFSSWFALCGLLTIAARLICKGQPPTDGTESNCEDSDY